MNHKGNLLSFSLYHLFHHLFKSADTLFPELHRIFSSRKCLCTSRINPALILWIPSQLLIILPLKGQNHIPASAHRQPALLPERISAVCLHLLSGLTITNSGFPLLPRPFSSFSEYAPGTNSAFISSSVTPIYRFSKFPFRRKMPNQLDFHLLYISSSFLCFSFDSLHNQSPN